MLRGALFVFAMLSSSAFADEIVKAEYGAPTTRYGHAILGDDVEYGALIMTLASGKKLRLTLPENHVFEDLEPRLADVDGDGDFEIVVIETDVAKGAALAIYDQSGKVAETPHIGQSRRWLAPIGVADLDNDGFVELAYIDRPHLARILTVWRFKDGALEPVATRQGLTNHKIGQDFISGGVRSCSDTPEMVTASADWTRIIASQLTSGNIQSRDLGPHSGPKSFDNAMACKS